MISIDTKITEILEEWESSVDVELDKIITRSLHYNVIPDIYNFIRFHETNNIDSRASKRKILNRFTSYKRALLHIFHIAAWSLKWILFFPFVRRYKTILLCSLNTERKLSKIYLDNLLHYSHERGALVVQFGTFTSFHAFLNPKVFSYPTFSVRLFSVNNKSDTSFVSQNIISKLENIVETKLKYGKPDLLKIQKYYFLYKNLFSLFTKFLNQISKKNNINFLIQDGGFTSTKILYAYAVSLNKIKTVLLDHAIIIYNHLYKNDLSDYYFCWGEFSKQRVNDLSYKKPKTNIISRPDIKWETETFKNNGNIILFCLPSLLNPILQTTNRSFEDSISNIRKVAKIVNEKLPNYKLIVKPHPEDDIQVFKKLKMKIYSSRLNNIIHDVCLLLTEDSTITLELLKYHIPLLYIIDGEKNDTFGFSKFGLKNLVTQIEEIELKIIEALETDIDISKKRKMFEYYFGQEAGKRNKLCEKLNEVLNE